MKTDYISELKSLVRSITIKSSHQCDSINKNIINSYGSNFLKDDINTWRYYLNLDGEYHFSNTQDIQVFVIETESYHKLTKDLLDVYPKTKGELIKYSRTYLDLIKKYPSDETLIKGILNPTPIEVSSIAKDGSIISFNTNTLDESDHAVLRLLSQYTQSIYLRWYNPMYSEIDEYYLSSFLMYVYSTLEAKIDLIRLENIHTHNAHPYHIEQFFRSTVGLNTNFLNRKSKLWLYQNLRAVMSNVGKSETFTQIVDNVLTPNGVGVGSVNIIKAKPLYSSFNARYEFIKPIYDTSRTNQLISVPLNEHYNLDTMSIPEIVSLEVENGYVHETQYMELNELINKVEDRVVLNNHIELDTKVIHLLRREDRDILPFPRVNMILDSLFYLHSKTSVDYTFTFTDSNTNIVYTLTFHQGVRLLVYLLLKMCDKPTEFIELESRSVIKKDPIDITNLLVNDDTTFDYLNLLDGIKPIMNTQYTEYPEIVAYVNEGIEYFTMDWILKSSMLNYVSIANMDLVDITRHTDSFTVTTDDINIEIDLLEDSSYRHFESIQELLLSISGGAFATDVNNLEADAIISYIELLSKLSSHNIQVIGNNRTGSALHLFDQGIGILEGESTVELSYFFNGLEDLVGDINIATPPTVVVNRTPPYQYLVNSDLHPMYGMWTKRGTLTEAIFNLHSEDVYEVTDVSSNQDEVYKESTLGPMSGLLLYKATTLPDDYRLGSSDIEDVDSADSNLDEIYKESQLGSMSGLMLYKATTLPDDYKLGSHTLEDVDGADSNFNEIYKSSNLDSMGGLMMYKASTIPDEYKLGTFNLPKIDKYTTNNDDTMMTLKLTTMNGLTNPTNIVSRKELKKLSLNQILNTDGQFTTNP